MASSSNNNTNVENITNKVATVALDDEEIEVEDTDFHEEQSVTKYDLRFALVGRFLTERFIRLNEMSQGDNLDKVDLNELAMWIQLHDLPTGWWSDSIARKIGSRLGEFQITTWVRKDYMQIRIKFDVLKPLKKMTNLKKPKGEGSHILFSMRYARPWRKIRRLNYATEEGVSVRNYGPELQALPRRAAQLRIGEKWLKAAPVMLTIEDGKAKISPPSRDDMDCGGNRENSNVGSDGEQKGAITIRGPHEDGNGKKVEPTSAPQTTKFTAGQIVNKLPESVFFEEVDVTGVEPKRKRVGLTQEAHSTNDPMEGDFSTADDHHPKNLELAGSAGQARREISEIANKLNYEGSYGVDCRGHSAGLGLIWRCKDKVTIRALMTDTLMLLLLKTNVFDASMKTWKSSSPGSLIESLDWKHLFNQSCLIHLSISTSDHLPVLLELRKFVPRQSLRRFNSQMGGASGDVALLNHAEYELNLVLRQEEEYWKQRAKLFWLKAGDSNSRAFHLAASKRRSRNAIANLRGEDGQMYGVDNGAKQIVVDYFEQLFRSGGCDISDVQSLISPVISMEQNESLTRPFAVEEVKDALFAMHPDKSPGDDGFSPGFYQRHWEIVGEDVVNACIGWLNDGMFPDSLNRTNIVLIPKKSEVISMTSANRLKKVLDGVVSRHKAPLFWRSITTLKWLEWMRMSIESESRSLKRFCCDIEFISQEINLNKSVLTFSRNTNDVVKRGIIDIAIAAAFEFVRRKVWNIIQNWNGRRLSRVGKEICLKAVAQSIPTYVVQLLLLPKDLCRDIESMMNGFLGF
ncbi:hypothetical protein AAG906_020970 [Vitis piasezkii]